jgi:hypothetical protein
MYSCADVLMDKEATIDCNTLLMYSTALVYCCTDARGGTLCWCTAVLLCYCTAVLMRIVTRMFRMTNVLGAD